MAAGARQGHGLIEPMESMADQRDVERMAGEDLGQMTSIECQV